MARKFIPVPPRSEEPWRYEILRRLSDAVKDLQAGLAAVNRGELADGSGTPLPPPSLSNYFYLPGRAGGQTGYGGTAAGNDLTLSSTAHSTKGSIFLGSSAEFDEVNTRLGVGLTSPAAIFHSKAVASSSTTKTAPTSGSFTGYSGAVTDLDEEPYDDSDYISTAGTLPSSNYVTFPAISDPGASGSLTIYLRYKWVGTSSGTVGVQLRVKLSDDGGVTDIADSGIMTVVAAGLNTDTGWVEYALTISAAELAAIDDWSALRVTFSAGGGGTGYSASFWGVSYISIWTQVSSTDDHYRATTGSTVVARINSAGNLSMGIDTTDPSGMVHLTARDATTIPLYMRGYSGQTADMTRWVGGSGTTLSVINNYGSFISTPASNVTTPIVSLQMGATSGVYTPNTALLLKLGANQSSGLGGTAMEVWRGTGSGYITAAISWEGAFISYAAGGSGLSWRETVSGTAMTLRGANTKQAELSISGISNSTKRTFSFPDYDGTIVVSGNTPTSGYTLQADVNGVPQWVSGGGGGDHGALTGLSDDDHTQYALLAGRSSGQTLYGGTASGEDLTLSSTAHATKGDIILGSATSAPYVTEDTSQSKLFFKYSSSPVAALMGGSASTNGDFQITPGHQTTTNMFRVFIQTMFTDASLTTVFSLGDAGSASPTPTTVTSRQVLIYGAYGSIGIGHLAILSKTSQISNEYAGYTEKQTDCVLSLTNSTSAAASGGGEGTDSLVVLRLRTRRTGQTANMMESISAVSGAATFTLNNKNILEASLSSAAFWVDATDNTKKLALTISGISTGTTRTWTVPNYGGNPAIASNTPSANTVLRFSSTQESWGTISAAYIDSRTRTVFVPIGSFYESTVLAQTLWDYLSPGGSPPNEWLYYPFPGSAVTYVAGYIHIPSDFSSVVAWNVVYANNGTSSNGWRPTLYVKQFSDGATATAAYDFAVSATVTPPTTAGVIDVASMGSTSTNMVAGSVHRITFYRDTLHAGDTNSSDMNVVGILLEYTADM